MYIRRKVFSSYIDEETGEEKMFSTTEFVNEETYLEEQREFGRAQRNLKLTVGDSGALQRARHTEAEYLNRMRNTVNKLKSDGAKDPEHLQKRLDEIRSDSRNRMKSTEDYLVKNSQKILDAEDKRLMGNKKYYQMKAKNIAEDASSKVKSAASDATSKLKSVGEQVSSKIDTSKIAKGFGNFLKKVK